MIVDLPTPKNRDELSLHRVGSWDDENSNGPNLQRSSKLEESLCPHAVLFGCFVYGINQVWKEGDPWLTWKTSFAPFRVLRVTSNRDGSIIVCSTDAETVALLRGSDGAVLATRKVSNDKEGTGTAAFAAHVSFIGASGQPCQATASKDAVLIRIPSSVGQKKTNFVLVSNIDTKSLNTTNAIQVAEAARKMTINSSLNFQMGDKSIVSCCGYFLCGGQVRFFALDSNGNIGCYDYAGPETPIKIVAYPLQWIKNDEELSSLDQSIGLRLHQLHGGKIYVMFATASKIYFLNPGELQIAGGCDMSSVLPKTSQLPKLLSLEPIESALPETGFAVAVAMKPKSGSRAIATIIETRVYDLKFGNFHPVYAVPIKETLLSLAACRSCHLGTYSLRFLVGQSLDDCACKAFLSSNYVHDGNMIGKIRLLIQCERFDEADILINNTGEAALVSDDFAHFHPSEVALGRLKHLLKAGNVSEKASMAEARQCFHRLSSGCISGNERAGQNLLCAADSISLWASPCASKNPPTLMEVTSALSTVCRVLGEVLKMLPTSRHLLFEAKRCQLEDQLATLRHLTSILPTESEDRLHFARCYQGSRNPGELFTKLVENESFPAAEELWNSLLRAKISPDVAVKAIVDIGANADPHAYIGLLEEHIIPSLSSHFHLLPPLWIWSKKLADEWDDNDDLCKAIDILQSIGRATNELQRGIHSSFAFHSPFIERQLTRKSKTLIANSRTTSVGDGSFSSAPATASTTPMQTKAVKSKQCSTDPASSFPTVLELGHIKRGAVKSRSMPSTIDALVDHSKENDTLDYAQVREKLQDAKCLRAARELGLKKSITSLRSFCDFGGMQNFSKELVASISTASKTHEERCSSFKNKLGPFCQKFDIDFDESLLKYLQGLCASTTATESTIQEAASVARCCENLATKCHGVLVVLRAALFCRYAPPWLKKLSKDAVEWSSCNLSLRSELIEASRLLLIDSIVRKYIGAAGCELFRVDNPRHALRLLDYVTQHFDRDSVLNDALDLADAFNHLSRLDACASLCSHAVSAGSVELCSDMVEELYLRDSRLADHACTRIVSFCSELVTECSAGLGMNLPESKVAKLKQQAVDASSAACAVLSISFAQRTTSAETFSTATYSKVDFSRLKALKLDFLRINELQRNHIVFLSFSDLRSTTTLLATASKLMVPVVTAYAGEDWTEFKIKLAHSKRACSLLAGAGECNESELWCSAVSVVASPLKWSHDDAISIDFLTDVGVLGGFSASNPLSVRVALSTAFLLCLKASNGGKTGFNGFNENIGRSVSLVHDYCLATCPENLLIQCQSLSSLTELVWHVVLRGDEGVGDKLEKFRCNLLIKSWSCQCQRGRVSDSRHHAVRTDSSDLLSLCRTPTLHPSWYIGDGLLLPPTESISRSVKFCKDVMNALTVSSCRFVPLASGGINEMTHFLFHRGALSVALRLLSCSSVLLLCSGAPNIAYGSLANSTQEVFTASAERSLGGTGNGIISQIVDSQHAVSFLLSLPVKLAFKVYKSALPTALSTRDYPRVIALANIGIVSGSGQRGSSASSPLQSAWKHQEKLIVQCKRISNQSVWWNFLKKHRISFDQRLFDEERGVDKSGAPYSQKLVTPIIIKLLSMTRNTNDSPVRRVLGVLKRYADTFALPHELLAEKYIEYLLSSPDGEVSLPDDTRLHLPKVEMSVKELFPCLQPKTKQAFVLRRCICALEENEQSAKDYDRHLLILQLYRDILQGFVVSKSEKLDRQLLEAELEAIHRRIDTLAILCSVFEGERKCDRPAFPSFFRPLPTEFSTYSKASGQICSILGRDSDNNDEFDPLEPLHGLLLRSRDLGVSTSLAPLGIPLGLPNGYIHARFLMEHFRMSTRQGSTMPSFDQDVLPVFGKVQVSGEKCALAEWCAMQFVTRDHDRLKCLELAHSCAIKHSNEAEQRKNRYLRNATEPAAISALAQEEMKALETVQRLSKLKSSLADKIKVATALQQDPGLEPISKELLQKLDRTVWHSGLAQPQPETVIDVLLTESSLLAANRCLDEVPLSMQLFKRLSIIVNAACQALAEEHSHVQVDRTAWSHVERWLFQGDEATATESVKPTKTRKADPMTPGKVLPIEDYKIVEAEDTTINFIMDLGTIQEDEPMWREDTIASLNVAEQRVTFDEERSALKKSEREQAEHMTIRTALRVAFVLACHHNTNYPDNDSEPSTKLADGSRFANRSSGKVKAGGLLARIEKLGSKQNTYVTACARDLLKVVFAKPELKCKSRFVAEAERNVGGTVTFSMRHRALRSAAVLVPQEALEKVIDEEGYLEASRDGETCSLKMCTFGAFVANECEEIGMPLTHSDLGHISSMHFSSYARTLFRFHRDGDQKASKGRLLLLLIQMSLKDEANIDAAFIELILKEMRRLHLPRSLLLACEYIAALKEEIGSERYDALVVACGDTVSAAIETAAKAVLSEVRDRIAGNSAAEDDFLDMTRTVYRLGQVVQRFAGTSEGQRQLARFVKVLGETITLVDGNKKLLSGLNRALFNAKRLLEVASL